MEKCQSLLEWFTQNGGQIGPSVELVWTKEEGTLFRATSHIPQDPNSQDPALLCRCPYALTLSHLNVLNTSNDRVRDHAGSSPIAKLVGQVEYSTVSYFFLVEQKALGIESFWHPYIDLLPTEDDLCTPLWFSDDDLVWLLGTNMHTSSEDESKSPVMLRRKMWKEQWMRGCEILADEGHDTAAYTWTTFLWAATMFTSRAFTSRINLPGAVQDITSTDQTFSILYPVIDTLNHRFGAKVAWDMSDGDFELSTLETIEKGEQIFNNYAPKGNEELLMGYGFCVESNPCDQFAIRLGKPPDEVIDALRQAFPNHFTSSNWTTECSTFYLRGSQHYTGGYDQESPNLRGVPMELFGAVNAILSYTNQDLDEDTLVDASISTILERLTAKRSAITQWNDKLAQGPANKRQRYAKIYRDGQLAILNEVIGELSDYFAD